MSAFTPREEFLCAACAKHQKTCCQTAEVFVTLGDVERIAAFTGRRDFFGFRPAENADYLDQDDDPLWRDYVFQADGTRRCVNKKPNDDCTFLGERGCVLPMEIRPLICRIYPYDYNEAGIEEDMSASWCPKSLLNPGETLIQALDMNRADAERWHAQLYHEIRVEAGLVAAK